MNRHMTQPSAKRRASTAEPHVFTHGRQRVHRATHVETPSVAYRTVHREGAIIRERGSPPTSSSPPDVNDFDRKIRKVIKQARESPKRKQDTERTKSHSVSSAKRSTEIREKKHGKKTSDSRTLQKSMKENSSFSSQKLVPRAPQTADFSKIDLMRPLHDSTDEKNAESRSALAELQRQEQMLAEAISNRMERKRNVSVKTKKAVLKAIMCSSPDKQEDPDLSAVSNLWVRAPKLQPAQVGKCKSQNQSNPRVPTTTLAGSKAFPPFQPLTELGGKSDHKANQTPAWLQKARTTFGRPHAREIDMPRPGNFHSTSQSQHRLWLKEVAKAISDARVTEVSSILRPALRSQSEFQALEDSGLPAKSSQPETSSSLRRVAFMKTEEEKMNPESIAAPPIASFMSSDGDDDDESVSSVVLLFNYLSCNAVPDRKFQITDRGNLVLVESLESEHNSPVQDYSIKQRHFPKFQLVCSQ